MAGATAIRIYRSPVKPSKPKPLDLTAPDTTAAKEPKSKTYDSYVLSYYSGGKRIRTRFNELQQARDKADAIKTSFMGNVGSDYHTTQRARNMEGEGKWN